MEKQEAVRDTLRRQGWSKQQIDEAICPTIAELNARTHSAACVAEQFRTRVAALRYVAPAVQKMGPPYKMVTVALPRWECSETHLASVSPTKITRKIREGYQHLREQGVNAAVFGIVEVAGLLEVDGGTLSWQPHAHIISAGATSSELRNAYSARKRKRGEKSRPVHVKDLEDLFRAFSYSLKCVDLRYNEYLNDGETRRRRNNMTGQHRDMLREWKASQTMSSMFEIRGIDKQDIQLFRRNDMASIIEDIA
jgi:hypothetical protein